MITITTGILMSDFSDYMQMNNHTVINTKSKANNLMKLDNKTSMNKKRPDDEKEMFEDPTIFPIFIDYMNFLKKKNLKKRADPNNLRTVGKNTRWNMDKNKRQNNTKKFKKLLKGKVMKA